MSREIERRWIVKKVDPNLGPRPSSWTPLRQGYLSSDTRIRVFDNYGVLTKKAGKGLSREETNTYVTRETADILFGACTYSLEKERLKVQGGWELDRYTGPLEGLYVLEREFDSEAEARTCSLPSWVSEAVEVTETLTNYQLARLSSLLEARGRSWSPIETVSAAPKSIVVTGAPCSGKSTAIARLKKERQDLHCVSESATILMAEVGITPDTGLQEFQSCLRATQTIFEDGALFQASQHGKKAVVFDRGTLDSAAFMGGLEVYEKAMETDRMAEFARYDAVLLLKLPSKEVFDRMKSNNPIRRETYEEALEVENRLIEVYMGHPEFILVDDADTWEEKYDSLVWAIEECLK